MPVVHITFDRTIMNPLSVHTKTHLLWVRDSILGILTDLECVRGIGTFGSFATGRWDEWSDVDLVVACNDPGHTGGLIVAEINARIPILCHRPFSARESPDGRYWFRDHSPFHKLDVSFHDEAGWSRAVHEHQQQGDLLLCPDGRGLRRRCEAPVFSWEYTLRQKALFDVMHRVHRYARAYARSGSDYESLSRELAEMKRNMADHCPENAYEERAWEVAGRVVVMAEKLHGDGMPRIGDHGSDGARR